MTNHIVYFLSVLWTR